jgi:cytochrome c6
MNGMKKKPTTVAVFTIAILTATTLLGVDGKTLYEQHCAKCHGADGKGSTKMGQKLGAKDYSKAKTWESLTDTGAVKAVKEGLKDKEGKVLMKPTEGLSDTEAKAIVEHMKILKQ